MEVTESTKKPLPWWVWLFPVLFGFLGGLISWIFFRKRQSAGWLIGIGLITQALVNLIVW